MTVHSYIRGIESGTAVETYRRELGIVPDENKGVALPLTDVVQQILQKIAAAEERAARLYRNQRGLVHDIAGAAVLVQVQDKTAPSGIHRLLTVDLFVYRSGLLTCIA